MATLLEKNTDGSIVLRIDGDLQFDSRDERIYHECLALPALALAEQRTDAPLRALVIGGGDGLVCRELLKSGRLSSIDLVDCSDSVVKIASTDPQLLSMNAGALLDSRVTVIIEDAWSFVENILDRKAQPFYNLVLVDLTVPQSFDACRFHTIDWYERLGRLIAPTLSSGSSTAGGILAINAVSPSRSTDAFWSVYNSVRAADLHARPYRIALKSFADCGYGPDWGFILGTHDPIHASDITQLHLPVPTMALHSNTHLLKFFEFPLEIAERRRVSMPTRLGSDLFLMYINSGVDFPSPWLHNWSSLQVDIDDAVIPPFDCGDKLLPPDVRNALRSADAELDEQTVFSRLVDLMPALNRGQTRYMVSEFLDDPARFLQSIDLPALVDRLLERAAELPAKFLDELKYLKSKLFEIITDHSRLFQLGSRVVTIVTLVVIIGNLLAPDAVYGKGHASGEFGVHTFSSDAHGFSRPSHSAMNEFGEPEVATGVGFRQFSRGRNLAVDETGTVYPARTYRYYPGYRSYHYFRSSSSSSSGPVHGTSSIHGHTNEAQAAYKLSPEADVLPDGEVVLALTDTVFMTLSSDVCTLTDSWTGDPIFDLSPDPAQIWRVHKEIERQRTGMSNTLQAKKEWIRWVSWLEFAPWRQDDLTELKNIEETERLLQGALDKLGAVSTVSPAITPPPSAGAYELFSSTWLLPGGVGIALKIPGGNVWYTDGAKFFSDASLSQQLPDEVPAGLRKMLIAYLSKNGKNYEADRRRLVQIRMDYEADLAALNQDLAEYNAARADTLLTDTVEYGSTYIPLQQALALTNLDIEKTKQRLSSKQKEIEDLPKEAAASEQAYKRFQEIDAALSRKSKGNRPPPANDVSHASDAQKEGSTEVKQ